MCELLLCELLFQDLNAKFLFFLVVLGLVQLFLGSLRRAGWCGENGSAQREDPWGSAGYARREAGSKPYSPSREVLCCAHILCNLLGDREA